MNFFWTYNHIIIFTSIFLLVAIVDVVVYCKIGKYRFAEKHILSYSIIGVMVATYIFRNLCGAISRDKNMIENFFVICEKTGNYLDKVSSEIITSYFIVILIFVSYFVERFLKNKGEDKEKLSQDYDKLAKKYYKEHLIKRTDDTFYPVVNMGTGSICIYYNGDEKGKKAELDRIHIEDSKNMYKLPGIVVENYKKLLDVHGTSLAYYNMNVRVKYMRFHDNELDLQTERTNYFYSLVTNRASDYKWNQLTIRELFEPGPRLKELEYAEVSNHLGFNGFLETNDGDIIFVKRNSQVSIGKRTYGDSVGASLKVKYALDDNDSFGVNGLVNAILEEIKDELSVDIQFIRQVNLIGAYRDIVESGKPQLLFWAKTTLSTADMAKTFYYNKRFVKNKKGTLKRDGDKIVWINKNDLNEIIFGEKEIQYKMLRMPMVPSAAAPIKILMGFLENEKKN